MSKTSLLLKASALSFAMAASSAAMAGPNCAATKAKEAAIYGNTTATNCANLTTTPNMAKNPYVYTSPNGGCDLGLSLPGLPSFGTGGGLGACEIARAITGPMVAQANQTMQQAASEAVSAAPKEAMDALANYNNSGGDLGSMVDKTYGQAGSPTPSYNPNK